MEIFSNYRWQGNIRQLKNITEQISIIESRREITAEIIRNYLPDYYESKLPALYDTIDKNLCHERESFTRSFDMKNDVNDLKTGF
jgi:DNA-binding NtrC family response regulator